MQDDRLRLIFTCCHPALSTEAQVALTLRLLGGLTTEEVARAFLVPEPTMAQRLVRAKHKIKLPPSRTGCPPMHELPDRLRPVLAVIYLIYNAGLTQPGPERGLCAEAIRLARASAALMPDEPEVAGLLALLLLTEARRASRVRADGSLVCSASKTARWDRAVIDEGQADRPLVSAPQSTRPVSVPGRDQRRARGRGERSRTPTGRRSSPCTTSYSRSPRRRWSR